MTKSAPMDLVARAAARIDLDHLTPPGTRSESGQPAANPVAETSPQNLPEPPPQNLSEPPAPASPGQRTGSQVEIDFVALQKAGFLTPQTQSSRIAEEFRLVKRPLLRIASDSREKENALDHVIMVTSALPDDGKTFVTTNLTMSMASERDLFVLAIDADIRRMGLSKRLGIADRPGIMDVLLNPSLSLSEVMVRTSIPNLALIPAGTGADGRATELFASQRMMKLVHDIANRYKDRIIVFDTPPVLAATEPGVLASHVGQVVFVVKSGETSKRSIVESMRLIDVCPNVHFVVNRVAQSSADDQFGYYGY